MHRTHSRWRLGMPHTICGALSETALFAHAQDLHWKAIGAMTGCPASRLRDAGGAEVYASIYFAEFEGGELGLAAFAPDDELELIGALGRYGPSMLDGVHTLHAAAPSSDASAQPDASVRLSFVLVASDSGPDALRISTPANAAFERIPSLPQEPDSYRRIKRAKATGVPGPWPPPGRPLWDGRFARAYAIDPDRDLNGVGLLYFANYVSFLDRAERDALTERVGIAPDQVSPRVTLRRTIAYYGNALPTDRLEITVEAYAATDMPDSFTVCHQVRRVSDRRLIALARADRRLRRRSEAVQ